MEGNEVLAVVIAVLSVITAWISYRQFNQKGMVFNNAYIYASKKQRETIDFRPYYRQSGIVFALISLMMLIMAASIYLKHEDLMLIVYSLVVVVVTYAIRSTIIIHKNKQKG
jgi:Ca2+/Na+ antiporter